MLKKIFTAIRNLFRVKPAESEKQKKPQKKQQKKRNRQQNPKQNRDHSNRSNRPQKHEKRDNPPPKERKVLNKKVTVPPPPPMPELIDIPAEEGKVRFQDLALAKEVIAGTQQLGFKYCSVIQEKALPHAIEGRDLAAKAQTGTGKTAAFLASSMTRLLQNPKENRRPKTCRVLVLEPTRELALQIEKDAEAIGKYTGLYSKAIFGGIDYKEQKNAIDIPVDILACTPGRMLDYARSGALDLSETEILIIDEADRMLDMGFFKDVTHILDKLKNKKSMGLFSATISQEVMTVSWMYQRDEVEITIPADQENKPDIDQYSLTVPPLEKTETTLRLIRAMQYERVIIFCNTKHMCQRLSDDLRRAGLDADCIHGDIKQSSREKTMKTFRDGKLSVLIATDVASRGIDVDDVDCVINFDVPEENEYYIHRIGRTGRAKRKGAAWSIIGNFPEKAKLDEIAKYSHFTVRPMKFIEGDLLVEEEVKKPVVRKKFR